MGIVLVSGSTRGRRSTAVRLSQGGASIVALSASLIAAPAAFAQAAPVPNLVSACSGVSLPRSVVTGIMTPVIAGIVTPVQNTVNPILGVVPLPLLQPLNIDAAGLLTNAAAGAPITLQVLNTNGTVVGPADRCDVQADSFTLKTAQGIGIGGNRITGLGTNGLDAAAGEASSIAFGNSARTNASATGAIAMGTRATVGANAVGSIAFGTDANATGGNSVALGAGSIAARGALAGYAAIGLAPLQTSAGEVSVGVAGGARQITNVAAGSAPTDAVNVAQLTGVAAQVGAITGNAAMYDDATHARITLTGATGTTIGNLAPGAVGATSTEAVNGAQLFATNGAVTTNTTAITNLTTSLGNGSIGTVQYSNAATPTVPNGGVPSNDLALVGATAAPVALHNVAAGSVATGSTDAVNGGQLATVAGQVGGLSALAVQYDDPTHARVTFGGAGATPVALGNVAAGTVAAGATDAVNGGQLFATNGAITNLTTNVANGGIGVLQYSNAGTPTTPNGGLPSNDVALVGAVPGAVAVHNVANGSVATGSTDAVNGGQLATVAGQVGGLSALAVQYDDPTHARVTLGGAGAAPVAFTNVAAGTLAAGSTDAVNGDQLFATNGSVTTNTTAIANLSTNIGNGSVGTVQYSNAATPTVPNGGIPSNDLALVGAAAAPVALHNVAAGSVATGSTDAVNGGQLATVAGQVGGLSALAVQYDDPTHARVTFGGAGATPVALGNVAAGTVAAGSTDAVNGGQLFATNGAITNLTTNVANGGIGVLQYSNAGTPTTPNGGLPSNDVALVGAVPGVVAVHNVANGSVATGSTDAVNGSQLATIAGQVGGLSALAVQYDDPTHARVTLGGAGAAPVAFTNVAAGTLAAGSTDAVNGGQLFATNATVTSNTTAITNLSTSLGNGGIGTVQYSNAATPTVPNGGIPSNDLALVGATTAPVALHNVAAGSVATESTDAVNGGQLATVAGQVGGLSALAVRYDDATHARITFGGMGATPVALTNVAAGTLAAGSTDAVNGGQVVALGRSVAAAFGGGSAYDPASNSVTTSIAYNGATYGSVQGALDAVSGTISGAINGGGIRYFHVLSTGADSTVTGVDSIAIGPASSVTAANSVALGTGATATRGATAGYAAVGLATPQTSVGEVSVGSAGAERQITNVAAGVAATDAANVGQVAGVAAQVAALGNSTVGYDGASKTVVTLAGAGGTTLTNVKAGAVSATSTDAVNGAQLAATNAAVTGNTTAITNLGASIANGSTGTVQYSNAAAPTTPNGGVPSNDVTLVGATTAPVGLHNVANGAIAAGSTDAVNGGQIYALANGAVNAVTYNTDASGTRMNSVTLAGGTAGVPVAVNDVAAGTVSAGSTQAVNGGQLYATNQAVTGVAQTADAAMTLAQNSVQYDAGSTPASTSVTFNSGNAPVALHNVAAGTSTTDAVNLGQLNAGISSAVSQANTYTDNRLAALNFDVQQARRDSFAGTSGALAAAGLPQAYEEGKGMIAIAGGTYAGQSAIAIGASKAFNDGHTVVKISGTYDSQGRGGASGGVGFQF